MSLISDERLAELANGARYATSDLSFLRMMLPSNPSSLEQAILTRVTAAVQSQADLTADLREAREQYATGQKQYDEGMAAFARMRQAVRYALGDAAKIASNPGWTDEDVLNGIEQWKQITVGLREQLTKAETAIKATIAEDGCDSSPILTAYFTEKEGAASREGDGT